MNQQVFIPSVLHVVATGVDISEDLNNTQNHSISSLLNAYEETEQQTDS